MGETTFTLKGVYKSGTAWKAWARFEVPTGERDETGQPVVRVKEKTRTFKVKGKREAEKLATAWVEQLNRNSQEAGQGVRPAETVGEYVDSYISGKEGTKERSTIAGYRRRAKYVKDGYGKVRGLGSVRLADLTTDMVRDWLRGIHSEGLSAQSANDARVILKSAMKDAYLAQRIPFNPVERVDKLTLGCAKEPNALGSTERARLVEDLFGGKAMANQSPAAKLGIELALFTGMRQGEICGLRWRNVDFATGTIRVRESIGRDGEASYTKNPKTGGSKRDIPMPSVIADEMRRRYSEMRERCMANGVRFDDAFFVLGDIDGSFLEPRLLFRAWDRRCKRLGLVGTQGKPPTFHDLRHTYATAAIAMGVDIKSVSSILGHANAAMTLNIYASSDPEAKRRAMEKVEAAMMRPAPQAEIIEFKQAANQ